MKKEYNVCVVTVTYGERSHLLKQVLDLCLQDEHIKKIVVVDNASNLTEIFFNSYDHEKIIWIRLEENTGSAGGYRVGIKEAYENSGCEYIWLLDDDNCPAKNSLEALLRFIDNKSESGLVAAQSMRPNSIVHKRLFSMKHPNCFFSTNDSFLGFNLSRFLYKFVFVLSRRKISLNKNLYDIDSIEVPTTGYGGLLIPQAVVKAIGYPREDFYLYGDDSEFTFRITKAGYKIFIVKASIVEDVDRSWNNTDSENSIIVFPILELGPDQRVYYSVRNQVWFEIDNFKNNKFIYNINKFTYLSLLFLTSVFGGKFKRFKLIMRAVKDGSNGNLGKIDL
jgi:GT2 family glycosyltransferase